MTRRAPCTVHRARRTAHGASRCVKELPGKRLRSSVAPATLETEQFESPQQVTGHRDTHRLVGVVPELGGEKVSKSRPFRRWNGSSTWAWEPITPSSSTGQPRSRCRNPSRETRLSQRGCAGSRGEESLVARCSACRLGSFVRSAGESLFPIADLGIR